MSMGLCPTRTTRVWEPRYYLNYEFNLSSLNGTDDDFNLVLNTCTVQVYMWADKSRIEHSRLLANFFAIWAKNDSVIMRRLLANIAKIERINLTKF